MARAKAKKKRSVRVTGTRSVSPEEGDVFDVERVRALVELMKEHDLSEVELRQADKKIRLRRGDKMPATLVASAPMITSAGSAPPATTQSTAGGAAASQTDDAESKNIVFVRSPMVGTFYAKSKPDVPPFVKVGDHVSQDTTVCIIEAMKVFNEITADCTGRIVAVLVENEQPVDVDKPLFKVDTST